MAGDPGSAAPGVGSVGGQGVPGVQVALSPRFEAGELQALFAAGWPGVDAPSAQRLAEHSLCWVGARSERRLIGFAKLAWDGDAHAFLLDPVVHPDHRRRGVGLQLVRHLVEAARRGGVEWLHVDYEPRLEGFYRRAGFRGTSAGVLRVRDSPPEPLAPPGACIEPYDEALRDACAELLAGLPEWFGIAEANRDYLWGLATLPSWVALAPGPERRLLGFVTVTSPMPRACEVHLLAVERRAHRSGIGRALMRFAEGWARGRGASYMQVKTLGPSHPDRHYRATRAFYESLGYVALFESDRLWHPSNPALVQVKALT